MQKKRCLIIRSRKAFGQVDWPISLGFFLIYLIWFFVIISPLAKTVKQSENPMMGLLEEKFNENAMWQMTSAPLIVTGNIMGSKEPVITSLPFNWSQSNIYMYGKYFMIDGGKMFFLTNLSAKSFFWVLHSEKDYALPPFSSDLSGDEDYSSVISRDFRADFGNSLLNSVIYRSRNRIKDFNIYVASIQIGTTDNNFTDTPLLHKYSVRGTADNAHYIFGDNSRVYSFIKTSSPKNILLKFSLANYTNYYADAGDFGTINYAVPGCTTRSGRFINLYDGSDAITFVFGSDVDIALCNDVFGLRAEFSVTLDGELQYDTYFHTGGKDEGIKFIGQKKTFGVFEPVTGISKDKLDALSILKYENLKRDWAFPQNSNFKIVVYNSTSILDNSTKMLDIGNDPYEFADVYAKTIKQDIIDKDNNRIRSTVNLRIWT